MHCGLRGDLRVVQVFRYNCILQRRAAYIRGRSTRPKMAAPCKARSSDPCQVRRVTEPVSSSKAWWDVATAAVAQSGSRILPAARRDPVLSPSFVRAHKKGRAVSLLSFGSRYLRGQSLFQSACSWVVKSACSPARVHPVHPAHWSRLLLTFMLRAVSAAADGTQSWTGSTSRSNDPQ